MGDSMIVGLQKICKYNRKNKKQAFTNTLTSGNHLFCRYMCKQPRLLSPLCTGILPADVCLHLWSQLLESTDSCHKNLLFSPNYRCEWALTFSVKINRSTISRCFILLCSTLFLFYIRCLYNTLLTDCRPNFHLLNYTNGSFNDCMTFTRPWASTTANDDNPDLQKPSFMRQYFHLVCVFLLLFSLYNLHFYKKNVCKIIYCT